MAKAKASLFIKYVRSKVGCAYLWGGQGESVYAMIKKTATSKCQSDDNTDKMLKFLAAHGVKDMQFFDCSGLGVSYLLDQNAISYDMTADGFYRKCVKINQKDARPGDMVFLLNSAGKAHHIGYIVEDGIVVHALNQTVGVIEEPLSKRKWVYGRPDFCIEYDLEEKKIDINSLKAGDKITLKKAVSGYNTAANAKAGVNPVSTYPAGTYYVFRVYGGTVNITKSKGTPGAWVVI